MIYIVVLPKDMNHRHCLMNSRMKVATMLKGSMLFMDLRHWMLPDASLVSIPIQMAVAGHSRVSTQTSLPTLLRQGGGIADIDVGLRQQNLPASALTQPSTPGASQLLHALTGESRYSVPQQVGKGATDAGAAAMRAPSAFGGSQINILPANADASVITPLSRQTITPSGAAGSQRSVAGVEPLSAFDKPITPSALDMPAGAGNRASSARYGALGAAGDTFVQAGVNAWNGESVDAAQLGQDVAISTTLGAGAAKLTDSLTPRLGSLRAGGGFGGALQASVSGYSNYQQYSAGEINGERAVATTLVDTRTAVAAGAAGAGVGALFGSVVPVAGTAVGAVVGFGAGVGAHYAIQAVDSVTGYSNAAKDSLTSGLESATGWVKSWW